MSHLSQAKKLPNGYFGIGICNPKYEVNLGTLWRSAFCFGASFIFVIGKKFKVQSSDTTTAWRKIPMYHYDSFEKFYENLPYSCRVVGVEIDEYSEDIYTFEHPKTCVYLLGAEDNGLSRDILDKCHHIIKIDTKTCLNVSVTGSIILYDRQCKEKTC